MNVVTRVELNLKTAVAAAMANVIAADVLALWRSLEPLLVELSDREQLRIGGTAIAQLAEVCQLKAERLLTDWEEIHNETGPAMAEDLLAGLVQRTMYLELSDLIRQPQPSPRKPAKPKQTVIGEVEKAKLIAFLAAQEAELEPETAEAALAVAHEEDVSQWVATISDWMKTHSKPSIRLLELQRSLKMPLIQVWLALLLGGYSLESRGGFYDSDQIWVTLAD
jgi:chromatin segregation and condensation protein Rec8/ScpA/Scc1 (kleisin family)